MQGLQAGSSGYLLTDSSHAQLLRLGFDAPQFSRKRHRYSCLDWSNRRDHLAGELADQLHLHLVVQGGVRQEAGVDLVSSAG